MGNSPHRLWGTESLVRSWLLWKLGWLSWVGFTLMGPTPLQVVCKGRSVAGTSAINRDQLAYRVTTVTLGLVDREKRKAHWVWGSR